MKIPKSGWIFFITFVILVPCGFCGLDINIITVINGLNPLYGYEYMAPSYDVAFDRMQIMFPRFANLSRFIVYTPGSFSCPDAAAMMTIISDRIGNILVNHPNDFNVLFSPGCSSEMIALGDFAREWDVPLFSNVASDQGLANKIRYPNTVTFSPNDHKTLSFGADLFLRQFGWKTVTFLCDTVSQYSGLSTFYVLSCGNIKRKLDSTGDYQILQLSFDSNTFQDYKGLLEQVKPISRVIILFTHPKNLRDILVVANRMGMTNGDYVYLSSQIPQVPYLGNLTWEYFDADDQDAFVAFQSLVVFHNPNANMEEINKLGMIDEISRITVEKYNFTLPVNAQFNDFAIAAQEMFEAFFLILNQSWSELQMDSIKDYHDFARRFWNKSFALPSRNVYLGINGMRVSDVQFFRLNLTTGFMEETYHYDATNNLMYTINIPLSQQWFNSTKSPPNQPLCGFRNDQCIPHYSNGAKEGSAVAVGVVVFIALFCIGYWKHSRIKELNTIWWSVNISFFSEISPHFNKKPEGGALNDLQPQGLDSVTDKQQRWYREEPVWVETLVPPRTVQQLADNKHFRKIFFSVRQLNNENICRFVGIIIDPKATLFLFEYGSRGNLRALLNNDNLSIDHGMQSSFIWDMLEGLGYLHKSNLQYHGRLSSLTCMLDKRFCLQLSSYAVAKVFSLLEGKNVLDPVDPVILWMAPELISDESFPAHPASDVFSLGVVLTEIATKATPMDVNLQNKSDIIKRIGQLKNDINGQRIEKIIDSSGEDGGVNYQLGRMINEQCLETDPNHRPILKTVVREFKLYLPQENFLTSILGCLEKYSTDLEFVVATRTEELLEEANKVDFLLSEMIPASFVKKLRNKEVVPMEDFDSVTVLFSDFPAFGPFCLGAQPIQVIFLLNDIYSIFDKILHLFDVYKVETINDSYMLASGLPTRNGNRHAGNIANMAMAMMQASWDIAQPETYSEKMRLRIGFNSGPCAAGIVGTRMPRYCLFGDTINTASRMESHGDVSRIHVSPTSKQLLDELGGFRTESRGEITIKGKGSMETFWLLGYL